MDRTFFRPLLFFVALIAGMLAWLLGAIVVLAVRVGLHSQVAVVGFVVVGVAAAAFVGRWRGTRRPLAVRTVWLAVGVLVGSILGGLHGLVLLGCLSAAAGFLIPALWYVFGSFVRAAWVRRHDFWVERDPERGRAGTTVGRLP